MAARRAKVAGILLVLLCLRSICFAGQIKKANVAGGFYPADKAQLETAVEGYLGSARPGHIPEGDVLVAFSPHAGYIYSGPVAAYTYKALSAKPFDRIVLVGMSHYFRFSGVKVLLADGYETPLGVARIDTQFVQGLTQKSGMFVVDNTVFEREHSLEVQLPFLQTVFPRGRYVFLLMSAIGPDEITNAAKGLYQTVSNAEGKTLVLVSTDMSHYHPYREAVDMDSATIEYISALDSKGLFAAITSGQAELCGWGAVMLGIEYAKLFGKTEFIMLKYANSGDTAGGKDKVVGYFSGLITRSDREAGMYSKEQRKELLRLARQSIEHYLTDRTTMELNISDPDLYKERGAFVTLKKNGQLRGCIGHIIADMPLCEVVRDMAIQAAVGDPRFPPVSLDEMDEIEIEISVLSPLSVVKDINDIKVGRHGLLLRKGFHSGLLLPQVPVEYGWDRDTFLQHLSLKAGLPPDGYKGGQIFSFTAEVFSESDVE